MDKRDIISGAGWLCLAVFVFIVSLDLGIGALQSPGPGFILFCGSLGLAFLAGVLILTGARQKGRLPLPHFWKDGHCGHVAMVAAALIVYSLLLTTLGYVLATLGLMVLLFALGKMKPWAVILGSLLAVFLSYGLFHYLLKTPLPQGLLAF
ncbi:MAG: tripartite tricarboxylate transporter TctB family protein [Deltaproteobacteria bacterium]|nr:tripartite tricarboxylate transporter TctB family protein [Deltaproteobacteria bacterium]